jgi:aspartyl-tRNA(Asn)/glutamyl-tRNA(Gln) amidotransferase subunit C
MEWLGYNGRMKLSLEEVEHIAQLARLELTDAEKEQYRQQLSAILDHVARLQELDTTGILPTASVLQSTVRLRPDEPTAGLSTEQVLANAPEQRKDQFQVPPVLE